MQTVMELKRSLHSSSLDTRQGSQHPRRRQPEPDYTAKVMQGSRINAFSRSIFCCTETFTRSWKEYPQGQTSFFFFFLRKPLDKDIKCNLEWLCIPLHLASWLLNPVSFFCNLISSRNIRWCLRYYLEKEMASHASTLPRELRGQRSLVGCCPWGRTESDTTEVT